MRLVKKKIVFSLLTRGLSAPFTILSPPLPRANKWTRPLGLDDIARQKTTLPVILNGWEFRIYRKVH